MSRGLVPAHRFLRFLLPYVGVFLAAACSSARLCSAEPRHFDADAGLPLVQNYPPDVYEAHAQIFASVEAPDGVLYFGTFGNVLSFDGERWRRYAVPGAWIRALAVGSDGLVYVGGNGVLGRLEPVPATGLLQFVSLTPRVPKAYSNFATAWSIGRLQNSVFIAIDGAVLEWTGTEFRAAPFPEQRPALRTADGQLFCHVGDQLLIRRGDAWTPHVRDSRLGEVRRLTLVSDGANGLVIGHDDGRMLRLTAGATTLAEWPEATAVVQPTGLRNAVRLADGRFVLSTNGDGLLILGGSGAPLQRLTGESGLAHTSTYGFTALRDGTLWVETANGLSHLDPRSNWSIFDQRNGRPPGIGGQPLARDGLTIVQYSDGGAVRLRPAATPLELTRLEPLPGTPARVGPLVFVHDALLTGNDRGLVRITEPSQLVYTADSQIEDILALPQESSLLALGLIRGLEVVRVSPSLAVQSLGRVPSFDAEVTNIESDAEDALWVGTVAGYALRIRPPRDENWTQAEVTRFDHTRGLPAGAVWVKTIPAGPEMLVCTQGGVFRHNRATDRLEPHPGFARHALAGVNNLPGTTDGRGRFWFQIARPGGGFEPGCLDLRGTAPVWTPLPATIGETLGYGGARVIAYDASAGRELLWVSGTRNTIRYELDRTPATQAPPDALLTLVAQGDVQWTTRAVRPQLPFAREPLRFQFSSPAASNGRVTYQTRLVGYQSTWSAAEGTTAVFTNLSGGPFRFEVRAIDANGRSGATAHYEFSVTPPWHRSPLAYAGYALAAGTGMAGFIRWRLGRARREHQRLEKLVATRTAELAAARDQAETASRAKSAFLASMSHELRTPLNGVIGYAQVLQSDKRLLPDQQERLRIVRASGEHLLRMINDVLDLAKIEAGKLELRPASVALRDLLQDISAAHQPAAHSKGLAFDLDVAADLPAWIEIDAQKLRQVLDNLVGNAMKFTMAGSVKLGARLAARPPEGRALPPDDGRVSIVFAITDTGPGISPEDQARLFQPFEQVAAARPSAPGTGLGLAISRALVERMGGRVALQSAEGRGSTFSFSLVVPTATPALAAPSEPLRVTGYEGPRRRILIVDDHPVNRSLLVDLLQPLGFQCTAYDSGAATLAAVSGNDAAWPDLAILDVRMEGLDGLELTRRLRTLAGARPLRVLLTSASVLTFDPADGLAAGCDDFLPKPFRTADLVEKIGALLALQWRATSSRSPFVATAARRTITPAARETLRELLTQGDLEAFRLTLARLRAEQPEAESHWLELDDAAAGFQLSRLRHLLEVA